MKATHWVFSNWFDQDWLVLPQADKVGKGKKPQNDTILMLIFAYIVTFKEKESF